MYGSQFTQALQSYKWETNVWQSGLSALTETKAAEGCKFYYYFLKQNTSSSIDIFFVNVSSRIGKKKTV